MAASLFGSLNTTDTLQALRISNGTVVQYGLDDVWTAVNAFLVAHNRLLAEQLALLATPTSMRLIRYGNPQSKTMSELDEYGISQGQKGRGGSEVGFPIRRFGAALSWNAAYFKMTLARDFAGEITQMVTADKRNVATLLQRALYRSTNYTFIDRIYDGASLGVKRLVNADSAALPIGPNGEEYVASTHTHYLARVGAFAQSDLSGALDHVTEHFNSGTAMIVINTAQETAVRGLADFIPFQYLGVTAAENTARALAEDINAFQVYNRKIGIFRGAEVWVKPWAIANYILVLAVNTGEPTVLAARVPAILGSDGAMGSALPSIISGGSETESGMGDLQVVATMDEYPMYSTQYQRMLDFGVRNRVAAAVLYVGGTSYVDPTI